MVLTPSTMLKLGTPAPDFDLPGLNGKQVALSAFRGKPALLVMFICNHCPYVKHVKSELTRLTADYGSKGVGIVGINSNDAVNYPDDSPANMKKWAKESGWTFPYLYDEDQSAAKSYHAACTPDFFLFDGEQKLFYRGQLDDSRPGNAIPVTGKDLRNALDLLLSGRSAPETQQPSMGCNLKWKSGNEPDYYGSSL